MSDASPSTDDPNFELLRGFLEDLRAAPEARLVVADYCDRYPGLVEQLLDMAEIDAALRVRTDSWSVPVGSGDDATGFDTVPGGQLGPYRILRVIGRGGMGEVFEAVEEPLNRLVAVKTIRRGRNTRPDWLRRFLREREALARLHHTHIVPIFAAGQEGELLYFAMPYIPGASLEQVIHAARRTELRTPGHMSSTLQDLVVKARSDEEKQESTKAKAACPMSVPATATVVELRGDYVRSTVAMMAAVAEALHHAHEGGIVHRDLKPSNIMVEPNGHPWVLDFGLASLRPDPSRPHPAHANALVPHVTVTVGILGTPPYMSPEQYESGREIDPRADVWGLGVTLYELLTLYQAFEGRESVLGSEPRPPRSLAKLSRDLEAICLKALKKDPARRYSTALGLADDLRRWLAGEPVDARPAWPPRRTLYWANRRKGAATAVVVSALALVALNFAMGKAAADKAEARTRVARVERDRALEKEKHNEQTIVINQAQRLRLSPHIDDWSDTHDKLMGRLTELKADRASRQSQTVAGYLGYDAVPRKVFEQSAVSASFDPLGRRLLFQRGVLDPKGANATPMVLWDEETDRAETFAAPPFADPAFLPDGTAVYLAPDASDPSVLVLQDLVKHVPIRRFPSPVDRPSIVRGRFLTRPATHVLAILVPHEKDHDAAGATAGALRTKPTTIAVWDVATAALVARINHQGTATLAIAPDGSLLAAGDESGGLTLWDLPEGRELARIPTGRFPVQAVAFGPDPRRGDGRDPGVPKWVVATGTGAGALTIWDLGSRQPRCFCPGSRVDVKVLDFSPDGQLLASGGRYEIKLWDAANGRHLLDIRATTYHLGLHFAPDGRRLAIAGPDIFGPGSAKIWELENGRGLTSLHGLSERVEELIIAPNGRRVAALSNDYRVGVWDWPGGRLVGVFDAPIADFIDNTHLAFDAEGRRLACAARDQVVHWDLETGRALGSWSLPPALGGTLAYVGNNRLLLLRTETRSAKRPPYGDVPYRDDPRVVRVYDLLGGTPTKAINEIKTFSIHVHRIAATAEAGYVAIDGIGEEAEGRVRVVQLYEGPDLKPLRPPLIHSPNMRTIPALKFDPTGTVLTLDTSTDPDPDDRGPAAYSIPSLKLVLGRGNGLFAVGPRAERRVGMDLESFPGETLFTLLEGDADQRLLTIPVMNKSTTPVFSRDGRYLLWGQPDGSVIVADFRELQSRLVLHDLGW